jgi:RHS repeat-associated protein
MGNLLEAIDRNGLKRTFEYDPVNQLLAETWWNGADRARTITFRYDAAGNMTSARDVDSAYRFEHDALSRVLNVENTSTPGAPALTLSYTYDPAGNVLSITDSLGTMVTSEYDPTGHLAGRRWQGHGADAVMVGFTYDAKGRLAQLDRSTEASPSSFIARSRFSYDALDRLTNLTYSLSSGAVHSSYEYGYDDASQLIRESHHGATATYTYDSAGQLTGVDRNPGADENYGYDANGNRNSVGYTVAAGNRIVSDNRFDYAYDLEGNLASKLDRATGERTSYAYDHRNRLVRVERRNSEGDLLSKVQFIYDVFNRRIGRIVDNIATYTVYENANAWADFDAAGNLLARYLFGDRPDQILARYLPTGGIVWYLVDKLGTIRDLLDSAGNVTDHIEYDAFGTPLSETNPSAGDRFKFTGREYDMESGLYYYRARYYDPALGRFISQDPLGFSAGDANFYRYVRNHPTNATDPSGLAAATEKGILTTASTAALIQKFECIGETMLEFTIQAAVESAINPCKFSLSTLEIVVDVTSCAAFPASRQLQKIFAGLSVAHRAPLFATLSKNADELIAIASDNFNVLGKFKKKVGPDYNLPVIPHPKGRWPEVDNTIGGYSNSDRFLLQRQTDPVAKAQNRAAATQPCRQALSGLWLPGIDIDEFPFASTKQGGAGANCNPISSSVNRSHGGWLGGQLRSNGLGQCRFYRRHRRLAG